MVGKGQRVGYVRVSSLEQNTDRQLDGIALDRVFTDKASGKDTQRPELQQALAYLREGDTLVVHSMDRLARNLRDMQDIVEGLTRRKVRVEFVKENLSFTGDDSPTAMLMLQIMGAVAQFERSMIRSRQMEGIALAKQAGVYAGKGRKKALTDEQAQAMRQRREAGESASALAREYGISRETFYSYCPAKAA